MEASVFAEKSPATGEALGTIEATPEADIGAIVRRAKEAQVRWAALDIEKRIKTVSKIKEKLLSRAEEIASIVRDETGKPIVEALLGEVLASADVVGYWATTIADELVPLEPEIDQLSYPKKSGWIHREARGVLGVIMPWNFPFALPLRTIVPALMAGNAVVFKPSEVTPRSGRAVAELFDGILPEGLFALVQGGGPVGAKVAADPNVDLVVFTGSPASGRKVAHACADLLKPCVLELGGKDAAIVLADADVTRAANGIVWGAMMNAGQNCGAVERVYVEKAAAKALTDAIVLATKALRLGEDVGGLTTAAQRAIVEKHVASAKEAGGKVLVGGESRDVAGAKMGYAPTVMTLESDATPLVTDETFGPVVPILAVEHVEEAIERANASRYGLTASIWTKDTRRGEELAMRLRAGVVTVNNHSFTGAIASAPWGGVGETGWGVTGSPLMLEHLTRPRFVLVDRNRAAREVWWYPYTDTLKQLALTFAALRGGASIGGRISAFFALLLLLPRRMGELKSGKAAAGATPAPEARAAGSAKADDEKDTA